MYLFLPLFYICTADLLSIVYLLTILLVLTIILSLILIILVILMFSYNNKSIYYKYGNKLVSFKTSEFYADTDRDPISLTNTYDILESREIPAENGKVIKQQRCTRCHRLKSVTNW